MSVSSDGRYPSNLAGVRFGKVIAVNLTNPGAPAQTWRCLCDCDRTVIIGRTSLIKSARLGHVSACENCRAYAPQKMVDRPFLDFAKVDTTPRTSRPKTPGSGIQRELGADVVMFDVRDVLLLVAKTFKLSVEELRSDDRHHHRTEARAAVYWLLANHTRMSISMIARTLGKRDHSTVINGLKRCNERREWDSWYREQVDSIERKLEERAKGATAA